MYTVQLYTQYSTVHMCMCACVLTEETCPPTQFKASLALPIVQATEAWHFVFANSATTVKCTVQVYVMHNTSCVQHTYMYAYVCVYVYVCMCRYTDTAVMHRS